MISLAIPLVKDRYNVSNYLKENPTGFSLIIYRFLNASLTMSIISTINVM